MWRHLKHDPAPILIDKLLSVDLKGPIGIEGHYHRANVRLHMKERQKIIIHLDSITKNLIVMHA